MAVTAAPFAAYVMDARSGQEIYSQNADTPLHPASLTKMMTLYMAFTAIERGQVRLDSKFLVSQHAASQPPSRLGLRPGQRIELRYLIRAAAVKSANDAATTIGENLAGSEPKFAAQMTAMAKALGMRNSQFRNANGLTIDGHYSTARDLTILGRRLFYDFPQYYSIFSRRTADAGIATVSSTNKRFLDSYEGADGIKTGYTRAAGFNLTASAQRGPKRLIATVLGGNSTAHRNAVMAQLLDAGFGKAPSRVREVKPAPVLVATPREVRRTVQVARNEPVVQVAPAAPVAAAPSRTQPAAAASTANAQVRLSASDRPVARASNTAVVTPQAISAAVERAQLAAREKQPGDASRPQRKPGQPVARASTKGADEIAAARPAGRPEGDSPEADGLASSARPNRAPRSDESASLDRSGAASLFVLSPVAPASGMALAERAAPKAGAILLTAPGAEATDPAQPVEVVARGDNGSSYGVSLGLYRSQSEAEQLLLRTALQENSALGNAASRVLNTQRGYEANFFGMSQETAELACSRLAARQQACTILGP
jgi:D-alanyl-D-alanine carboxypeptidase